MNPDGAYGLQCVDVADDYCQAIFGSWQSTIGGGNANQLFRSSDKLWAIGYNGSNRPERGDIIIWGGDGLNPYGHIAVVASSTKENVSVVQQNYNTGGAANKPASLDVMPYSAAGMGACVGWLRPKVDGATTPDPGEVVLGNGAAGGAGGAMRKPLSGSERQAKGGSAGYSESGMDWDKLCELEASGRWDCNTGNSFYGGLQFTYTTWLEFGGGKYADYAHKATREQQIEIAEKVLVGQGVGAWPVNGPKCYDPNAAQRQHGEGDGDAANQGADFYSAPSPTATKTKHVNGGAIVEFQGFVLGEWHNRSSFWYKNGDGYSPFNSWDPERTTGLKDLTPYDTWKVVIPEGPNFAANRPETIGKTLPHSSTWTYSGGTLSSTGASAGTYYCPPGTPQAAAEAAGGYEYDIPNGPVNWGDIPEDLWNYLMSIGWYGVAGDGHERLYPPTSGMKTATGSNTDGTVGAYRGPITYGEVSDEEWNNLKNQGWFGVPGDGYERIYPPTTTGTETLWLDWREVFPYEGTSPLNTAAMGAWNWLMDKAGWRGLTREGMQQIPGAQGESIFSPQHPLFARYNAGLHRRILANYYVVRVLMDDVGARMYACLQRAGWQKRGAWLYPPDGENPNGVRGI